MVQVTRFSGFVQNLMVITVVSEVRPHSPEKWLDLAFTANCGGVWAARLPADRTKFCNLSDSELNGTGGEM